MRRQEGESRTQLGEPLIKVDPKHIDGRTRLPSILPMAVLTTMAGWIGKEKSNIAHPSGISFNLETGRGILDYFLFNYKAQAPSLDGKSREEYVKVASFIAVGQGDESGTLTQNLLNEGNKNLQGGSGKRAK